MIIVTEISLCVLVYVTVPYKAPRKVPVPRGRYGDTRFTTFGSKAEIPRRVDAFE